MDVYILDDNFQVTGLLDTFESFIWTERYFECGDFEIHMPVSTQALEYIKIGAYLWTKESDYTMILENVEINTSAEGKKELILTGRSTESILDRRIVWDETILSGSFQSEYERLLNENIINPKISDRAFSNFSFQTLNDSNVNSMEIDLALFGDELYSTTVELCKEKGLGFRVKPKEIKGFTFYFYNGVDRSYSQEANPWVVFSPSYDNLLSSNYINSKKLFKTVALVSGTKTEKTGYYDEEGEFQTEEQEVNVTVTAIDTDPAGSGLDRREMFVEVSSIDAVIPEGYELTEQGYLDQLEYEGKLELRETKITTAFEGQIETARQFIYKRDFNIGDIVQVVNEYGVEGRVRITEIVHSIDASGEKLTPTFESVY